VLAVQISPSKRGAKIPLISLSPAKCPKLLLLETQLTAVNNHMNSLSQSFVGFAGEEDISWLALFSAILRDTTLHRDVRYKVLVIYHAWSISKLILYLRAKN
jgi:hypothetical protein